MQNLILFSRRPDWRDYSSSLLIDANKRWHCAVGCLLYFKLVAVHMMILLSLSELSVDTMVSDLQSTVSGRVLKCLHTLKKRFVAGGSSNSRVDERHRVKVCSNMCGILVDFSDEKCYIGSAVWHDNWRWRKLFWEIHETFSFTILLIWLSDWCKCVLPGIDLYNGKNARRHIFIMRRTGKWCKAYSLK